MSAMIIYPPAVPPLAKIIHQNNTNQHKLMLACWLTTLYISDWVILQLILKLADITVVLMYKCSCECNVYILPVTLNHMIAAKCSFLPACQVK